MTTLLICNRHGGFGLSRKAFLRLRELGHPLALAEPDIGEYYPDGSGPRPDYYGSFCDHIPRDDPLMLQVYEELGDEANGQYCHLELVTIPDDVEWVIEEYDGSEWVSEKHRTWR